MKERYLKSIKYHLNSGNYRFPFLKPDDLKLLRQGSVPTFLFLCLYITYNIIKKFFVNPYFSLNIEQMNKNDKEAIKSRINEERIDNLLSNSF